MATEATKCAHCGLPIELIGPPIALVWKHRGNRHHLCDPNSLESDTFAEPAA